jgi:hypothetical protein
MKQTKPEEFAYLKNCIDMKKKIPKKIKEALDKVFKILAFKKLEEIETNIYFGKKKK